MAGHFPNDAQHIDDDEEEVMYDQIQQFVEDQDIVIEDQDIVVEDEEGDEEDDEEEEDDPHDEDYVHTPRAEVLPRVSPAPLIGRSSENVVEEYEDSQRRMGGGETSLSQCHRVEDGENSSGGEWNMSEIDGLFCPICMEAWTNGGEHQICCLPCGHLYGLSCINKWFKQHRNSRKCPQCNRTCCLKDVRVLYASQIVVVDQELQKKVRSLEAVCLSLEKKDAQWCKKEVEWQRKEADLRLKMNQLMECRRVRAEERGEEYVRVGSPLGGAADERAADDGEDGSDSDDAMDADDHPQAAEEPAVTRAEFPEFQAVVAQLRTDMAASRAQSEAKYAALQRTLDEILRRLRQDASTASAAPPDA